MQRGERHGRGSIARHGFKKHGPTSTTLVKGFRDQKAMVLRCHANDVALARSTELCDALERQLEQTFVTNNRCELFWEVLARQWP